MRIVIVSNPERKDFHNYIVDHFAQKHELFMLWDYDVGRTPDPYYEGRVTFLYWKDYLTPKALLDKIKPSRILFFEAIDFWQIPLIIACHKFKITSFYIEHGVGNSVDSVISRFNELPPLSKRVGFFIRKLFTGFSKALKNRIYFLSAVKYLEPRDRLKYLKLLGYYKMFTPIQALSKLKFRSRTPHFAILFNRNNIEPYLLFNTIEQQNIITEGVPFFDKYYFQDYYEYDHVFFIEHPYLEFNILEWDDAYHERIARTIEKFAIDRKREIIVKLHPRSDIRNWTRYNLHPLVKIKQKEDVTAEMLSAKLVLGYSSTLINVLISCKKNIVLLGWHPNPKIFGDDISRTGLCHISFNPDDLFEKYEYWCAVNLSHKNESALNNYLREYNYPFDGRATERVIKAIVERVVSE